MGTKREDVEAAFCAVIGCKSSKRLGWGEELDALADFLRADETVFRLAIWHTDPSARVGKHIQLMSLLTATSQRFIYQRPKTAAQWKWKPKQEWGFFTFDFEDIVDVLYRKVRFTFTGTITLLVSDGRKVDFDLLDEEAQALYRAIRDASGRG